MISWSDLWTVSYTVAGVAFVVLGRRADRRAAARGPLGRHQPDRGRRRDGRGHGRPASLLIAKEMFISQGDLDLVMAVVVIAGIAGFAVALLVGRRIGASEPAAARRGAGGGPQRLLPPA